MTDITYRVIPSDYPQISVINNFDAVTTFGDSYAYALFIHGLATAHQNGVNVTLYDIKGDVVVGTVAQLDPA